MLYWLGVLTSQYNFYQLKVLVNENAKKFIYVRVSYKHFSLMILS